MATTTYTIRIHDRASPAAKQVAGALDRLNHAAVRTAKAFESGSKVERKMASEAERLARAQLRAAKTIMQTAKATERLNVAGRKSKGLLSGLGTAAAGVAGIFSSYLIGATIRTGREFLEAAGNAQILERNFARVTGDPRELEQTRGLIKSLGLDLEAGEKAALKLRTSFERFTAEHLLKTFSALSLGADEVQRASLALSQIQGRGRLQAEELNQFIEAVPGVDRGKIIDQLAKELQITTQEAAHRLGKGKIQADVGIRALIFGALESQKLSDPSGGRGFGGVDKAIVAGADDINRQLMRLDNTILEFKRNVGKGLEELGVVKLLGGIADGLARINQANPKVLGALALAFGGLAIALGTLGAVAGAVFVVSSALGVLTGTLIPAAAAAWAFVAPILVAAAPFIAAGAAIAFLAYQINALVKAWDGDLLLKTLTEDLSKLGAFLSGLATQALDWGRNIVQGLVDGITGGIGRAVGAITDLGKGVIDGAKDVFGINSPSKEFRSIAHDDVDGLVVGFEESQDLAFTSAEALAEGVVSEAAMVAATGTGVNPAAMANVGAAAGNALAAGSGRAGARIGKIEVGITVDGSRDAASTVQAIRSFFDTDFAALLERHLEGAGA